ncbi:TonB-dependent receptor [Exilibacterium tricleocarpae]|uniref:TonB-dependent receptor n=1 Tax=Exilibacterium tricleocarpae TaxID=2591008 RepID=A0A545TZI3_9GAMM|nr:TonB-dependent receptor [Exilibacterium tricleocarpae]TQV82632.1 TonB-dependent receptor [Exilibacterium tricleocarpae]
MKRSTGLNLQRLALPGLALAVTLAPHLHAEEIEEIMVTSSKRGPQSLQSIPLSVQALTGEQLAAAGASDFNGFFRLIPGLSVFDQGPGDKRYIIRGVNATGAGTVGLYLDEVVITGENAQDGGGRQPDIKLFDIDRVEVLKGPQGTTFGSSSLSGTIRYITNKPELTEAELNLQATLRHISGADIGGQVEAAVNLPVIEDKLAVRLAALRLDEDGFIDSRFDDGVNSDSTTAARASLLYAPNDALSLSLMAMFQNLETDGPAYFNRVDGTGTALADLTQADLSANPFDDEIRIYNATLEYGSDYGTFTGTVSKLDRDTVFNRDASAAVGPTSVITQPKDRQVESYEIRFTSAWDSPVQALAGFFAQDEERFFQSRIFPSDPVTGKFSEVSGFSLDRNVDTSVSEQALFAELSVDVTEELTLTGGIRWFDIDVDEVATAVQGFSGAPGAGRGPRLKFGEDDTIGKLNLSYQVNNDLMTFLQWSQGFRAGGTNDQTAAEIAQVTIPAGFGSDALDNYEIGVKSTWMEGKLLANASLYYIDWADIQIQDQAQDPNNPSVFFPFRANGGGADIYGIEIDITASPIPGLDLGLVASYTDAELSEDNPLATSGLKGDGITYIPETTLTLTGQYARPLPYRDLTGFVGADLSYVDERNTELRPNSPLFVTLDSYSLVNLRVGVESDTWSAVLAVHNAFDDDTAVDVFRIIPGLTPDGFIPQRPRTVALSFQQRFF